MSGVFVNSHNLIDTWAENLSSRVLVPGVCSAYRVAAGVSIGVAKLVSERSAKRAYNLFFDPLTAAAVLSMTRPVENLTASIAKRKPLKSPFPLHYLDQSTISMCQHLSAYAKRINQLLAVPENLKLFARRATVESFLLQLGIQSPRVVSFAHCVVIQIKYACLSLLKYVAIALDFIFKSVFLGVNFGLFSYIKEIILDAQKHIEERFADLAIQSIEKKEAELRRLIFSSTAGCVVEYCVSCSTHAVVKSLAGFGLYLPVKSLAVSWLGAPEWVVHTVGLSIFSSVFCSSVIRPTFDPYYEGFDPAFYLGRLSYYDFCKYYGIEKFYGAVYLAGRYFKSSISG